MNGRSFAPGLLLAVVSLLPFSCPVSAQTVSPLKWGERATELVELFDKLIMRKGS